jgi:hypothetical protein
MDFPAKRKIRWEDWLFSHLFFCVIPYNDGLLTVGIALYKLELIITRGGGLITYAPNPGMFIRTQGHHIQKIIVTMSLSIPWKIGRNIMPSCLDFWALEISI